jgi:hypothetical protein
MILRYSDGEIETLVRAAKHGDLHRLRRPRWIAKRGHREADAGFIGGLGQPFRVVLRQNRLNPLDFSVILGLTPPSSTRLFRLPRYNGKSHEHTNRIERNRLYGFHVHFATARYQLAGLDEDGYAEETDRYADLPGAVECLLADCGFSPDAGAADGERR